MPGLCPEGHQAVYGGWCDSMRPVDIVTSEIEGWRRDEFARMSEGVTLEPDGKFLWIY